LGGGTRTTNRHTSQPGAQRKGKDSVLTWLDGLGFASEVIRRDLEHVEDLGTHFFTEVKDAEHCASLCCRPPSYVTVASWPSGLWAARGSSRLRLSFSMSWNAAQRLSSWRVSLAAVDAQIAVIKSQLDQHEDDDPSLWPLRRKLVGLHNKRRELEEQLKKGGK
jgi:hypothetical protein